MDFGFLDFSTLEKRKHYCEQELELNKRLSPEIYLEVVPVTVREGGRKVIKPLNGTDDLFRCLCLGITFLLDPKYTPRFERHGGVMKAGARVPGVVRLSSGAGSVGRPRLDGMTGVGVRKPFGTGRLT